MTSLIFNFIGNFIISMKKPRVLLVSYASKKEQQKIINYVVLHKDEFIEFLNSF